MTTFFDTCWYCALFYNHDPKYPQKKVTDLSEPLTPRCSWHSDYKCDICEKDNHFNGTAWCDKCKQWFCIKCAAKIQIKKERFWGYDYYFELECPECKNNYPALDYAEYCGKHPYQLQAVEIQERKSSEKGRSDSSIASPRLDDFLISNFGVGVFAFKQRGNIEDYSPQETWNKLADQWAPNYGKYGDNNHQYWILPTLFKQLGNVEGLTILDGGTGEGYLARLLAQKGANVYGIDISEEMLGYAIKREESDPLGIQYIHGSLAEMAMFEDNFFDLVVANMMIFNAQEFEKIFSEIHRVLRPSGKFAFSILHPIKVVMSSLRRPRSTFRMEEQTYLLSDYYDERPILATFTHTSHPDVIYPRTISQYINQLVDSGFEVVRFEEPLPSEEGIKKVPWKYLNRHYPFCCWFFTKKKE
ncbi:MAG: methyltransferase domain-containing protein [Candidatus Heimdallarchaeota archaeon]|nr:methyltransferase domain-containing protein [Candidatus Heimdallarchaeota archaeon]